MYELCPVLVISGDKFSPKLAEAQLGIVFTTKNEPGELGRRGVLKNKPMTYGSATLCPPDDVSNQSSYYSGFNWLVDILGDVVDVVRGYGAEDIYLDLGVISRTPPNLSFKP